MADEPDIPRVFRNAFEERALQIVEILDEPALSALPVRFPYTRSFDYRGPGLTLTGLEAAGGRVMTYDVTLAKSDATTVDRELRKAIDAYDRAG
ncbi:MAG: hypothetical protein ACTSYE_00680 [Alphaproteobacteria bacterium]